MTAHFKNVQQQFGTRSKTFDISANWITDQALIQTHVDLAGSQRGKGLEICCGTGMVGRRLLDAGWQMMGFDITPEMVEQTRLYYPAFEHNVEEDFPLPDESCDLVVMRQAFFLFDGPTILPHIKRVLKPSGRFVMSQTVPFLDPEDEIWLKKVHQTKQAQLLRFYTGPDLKNILQTGGFTILAEQYLTVRECITNWMRHAPELTEETRQKVIDLIRNTPSNLQKYRDVTEKDGELYENWNWVLLAAQKRV